MRLFNWVVFLNVSNAWLLSDIACESQALSCDIKIIPDMPWIEQTAFSKIIYFLSIDEYLFHTDRYLISVL